MTRNSIKYVRDELQKLAEKEGDKPLARRLGVPFGQVRSMLDGRDPLASNLFKIANALGLDAYIGPPSPTPPTPVPTTVQELGPSEASHFEVSKQKDGYVGVVIFVPEGSARLYLETSLSKSLADQLTYRAMQAEESDA